MAKTHIKKKASRSEIVRAIRLTWDSMDSHLDESVSATCAKKCCRDNVGLPPFHAKCVREYAEILRVLASFLWCWWIACGAILRGCAAVPYVTCSSCLYLLVCAVFFNYTVRGHEKNRVCGYFLTAYQDTGAICDESRLAVEWPRTLTLIVPYSSARISYRRDRIRIVSRARPSSESEKILCWMNRKRVALSPRHVRKRWTRHAYGLLGAGNVAMPRVWATSSCCDLCQ